MAHIHSDGINRKVRGDGTCGRCRGDFGDGDRCRNCGVHFDRRTVRGRRSRPIGGKRGRNSGNVSQHGKKGNG